MFKCAIKVIIIIWYFWVPLERWSGKTWGDEDARERDTTNSSALPLTQVWEVKWSWEKEKWRYNVLHVDIIQHFNSELKRRFEPDARQPNVRFLHPWAVFCRVVWCPNFRAKRSIKTISYRNLGFMTYWTRYRSAFLLTCVECLCLSSLLKEETKAQCWAKIKKKENVRSAPCHNAW